MVAFVKSVSATSSQRMLVFGIIALTMILGIGFVNHSRGLELSARLLYSFAFILACILYSDYKGYKRYVNTATVIAVNCFLVLISFAEGLDTGGYLFILPTIFALVFMMGNTREYKVEVLFNFIISILSFASCVLFVPDKSNWQPISEEIFEKMFAMNTISVVVLCAIFAYIGIYYERRVIARLIDEKNRAEWQEKKIREQNDKLRELAFMSSHTVRAPLSNILGLTAYIRELGTDKEAEQFVINGIRESAMQLDGAIHTMVEKTGSLIKQ
jgi:signal transduction histidine kinase